MILFLVILISNARAAILFSQNFDDDPTGAYTESTWTEDWVTPFLLKWYHNSLSQTSIVDSGHTGKALKTQNIIQGNRQKGLAGNHTSKAIHILDYMHQPG